MQQLKCSHVARAIRTGFRSGNNRFGRDHAVALPGALCCGRPYAQTSTPRSSDGDASFDRIRFEQSMKKHLFYIPAFDIYQGIGTAETRGLYDYGPPGCALQANVVDIWRKHFVLEEDMLEIDCTSLTPHEVLKTSGHVDRFTDWICMDSKTGEGFRVDHLIKETVESRLRESNTRNRSTVKRNDSQLDAFQEKEFRGVIAELDSYDREGLAKAIQKYDIRSPSTGNALESPMPFNLMFETKIGPRIRSTTDASSFLRPETAQGQFLNFQKLFDYNQGSMPFASASVGKCYRNEISPKYGLLRVREFLLAEVEHYVDPQGDKSHHRFNEIANVKLSLLARESQTAHEPRVRHITIAEAVSQRIIDNQTLGYFLARTQLFLEKCGVNPKRLRFRQHTTGEMAHYATDCWDAEILTSYGWIEAVGCADRSAHDLIVHSKRTGRPMTVREQLIEPFEIEQYEVEIHRKTLGLRFRQASKSIEQTLLDCDQQTLERLALDLSKFNEIKIQLDGGSEWVTLDSDLVSITKQKRMVSQREYTPNVIEPSFGIGRILYALLEHSWWIRDDGRGVLSLPPTIAPIKVLVTPLSRHPKLVPLARRFISKLKELGIRSRFDDSGSSVGRRYGRADELGTPLGVTVDFQSFQDGTLTLRDRDTLDQVRGDENQICEAIGSLVRNEESWQRIAGRLTKFEGQKIN